MSRVALLSVITAIGLGSSPLALAQGQPAQPMAPVAPPVVAPPPPEPATAPALAPAPAPASSPAEPPGAAWHQGPRGRRRVWRSVGVVAAGAAYLASETILKGPLAPDECRWCAPPSIDEQVRDALRWNDRDRANSLSNYTGYLAAPVLAVGLAAVIGAERGGSDSTFARILDDTLPVLEAVAYSQLVVQAVKFSVGRQRPRVHFAPSPMEPTDEDNLSFFSGHSALAFALTTSAGLVARRRDSRLEPVIWTLGVGLAGSTAFLRIAADRHYFSDVVVGSAFGMAAGYLAVRFAERGDRRVMVLPAPGGLRLVGAL